MGPHGPLVLAETRAQSHSIRSVRPGRMGYTTYLRVGNTLGPNGFSSGSSTRVSRSKCPRS